MASGRGEGHRQSVEPSKLVVSELRAPQMSRLVPDFGGRLFETNDRGHGGETEYVAAGGVPGRCLWTQAVGCRGQGVLVSGECRLKTCLGHPDRRLVPEHPCTYK